MEQNYVFLMSAYNQIEADNISGILEAEGIHSRLKKDIREEFFNSLGEYNSSIAIYVPDHDYERAKQIIEVEMVRGDF